MWEDSANKEGGRFVIKVGTGRDETEKLNEYWEHLLLAMIGEYAEDGVTAIPGGHITGAVLGRRKQQTKISVWTRDRSKKEALEELKVKLISLLQVRYFYLFNYTQRLALSIKKTNKQTNSLREMRLTFTTKIITRDQGQNLSSVEKALLLSICLAITVL